MQVGNRAQQYERSKHCIARHSRHMTKRTANALEKAEQTRVRRVGKKACQERE